MKGKVKIVTNGLLKENPSLRLVLGTCPTLALTTLAVNGLGMGLAATFVLICSNMAISALRKIIPDKVRLPAYITVIAAFVTILQMIVQAYLPSLDAALGIYLPLIVVNCIILGRAEMFASKNGVLDSALDGLGMGLGFTLTLLVMGSIRELLGAGSVFGFPVFDSLFAALGLEMTFEPMTVLITPPGGFFVFGCLMALVIWIETKTNNRIQRKMGCEGCPAHGACSGCDKAEKGGAAA
ncbi:MAG TPA: electron transport complex subunit E [Candidatus Ruthenibacterium merdigallinarum]|nr:electron transport complex subunit E [Candidatus Ruthenibacterium merdigallinarum]